MQVLSGVSMMTHDPKAMAAMRQKFFASADADGDGKLTLGEFKTAGAKNNQSQALSLDGANGVAPTAAPSVTIAGPGNGEAPDLEKLFSEMDTDGDGGVTEKEIEAFEAKMSKDTMTAMLSLQGLDQNVQPNSNEDASMKDIVKQLQSILDKFKESEKSSSQSLVTA